jgi:anhydro-N-acetylmuramic acid kinase
VKPYHNDDLQWDGGEDEGETSIKGRVVKQAATSMQVLGMMSGTSADGIDAALVDISGAPPAISAKLAGHHHISFPLHVRKKILRLANNAVTTTAEISELNFVLGEWFAEAAIESCRKWHVLPRNLSLIGSHGQTVYHQGSPGIVLGARRIASTLQIGELSVIAERTGVPTVGNFRPRDIAAGGQGAPLVPFVDYLLYLDSRLNRVALNIGGIANVTVIPAGARPGDVFAFDTGPGNMIVDALVEKITQGRSTYDRNSRIALSGRTIPELFSRMMREQYLRKKPPKTAGREQFGRHYSDVLLEWGRKHHVAPADVVRTATVFTSLSIADAFRRFILPRVKVSELIVAGGGTRNPLIMAQLAAALPDIDIVSSSQFGVSAEAKEAFAFAVLAYEAYHGRPNNLPSATGAAHAAVLGDFVHGAYKGKK